MTISSEIGPVVYTGDGTSGPYTFSWKITAAADLEVIIRDMTDLTDKGTILTLNAANGYTVAGVNAAGGGSITLTGTYATSVTSDFKLMIRDALDTTQPSDFRNNTTLTGPALETAVDRNTRQINMLRERLDLAVKFADILDDQSPAIVTNNTLPVPSAETVLARSASNEWEFTTFAALGINITWPGSTTDNALLKADGTAGDSYQMTGVIVDDSNNVSGVGNVGMSGHIIDANGNEIVKTGQTASAVNEVTVTNAATGNAPAIAATGDDTNIDLDIAAKGTGDINLSSDLVSTEEGTFDGAIYAGTGAGTTDGFSIGTHSATWRRITHSGTGYFMWDSQFAYGNLTVQQFTANTNIIANGTLAITGTSTFSDDIKIGGTVAPDGGQWSGAAIFGDDANDKVVVGQTSGGVAAVQGVTTGGSADALSVNPNGGLVTVGSGGLHVDGTLDMDSNAVSNVTTIGMTGRLTQQLSADSAAHKIERTGSATGSFWLGATGDRDGSNTYDEARIWNGALSQYLNFTYNDSTNWEIGVSTGDLAIKADLDMDSNDIDNVNDLNVAGFLTLEGTSNGVVTNTSDGSDNAEVYINAGGAGSTTRGAMIILDGNEHAGTGLLSLEAGNVSGGKVRLQTQGTERFSAEYDGTLDCHDNDLVGVGTNTPASAAATGTTGTITWDASYIYIATATNTWKRVAIATW